MAIGTNQQVLLSDGTDVAWGTSPGIAGSIEQIVNVQDGNLATTTTLIPEDDTIPQNTEGGELMTLAITPANSSNILHIDVVCYMSPPNAENIHVALFQDATAGALAAGSSRPDGSTSLTAVVFKHKMVAGTTSSTTFKVRGSGPDAGTYTFNGQSGARIFGGVMASSITITEIKV